MKAESIESSLHARIWSFNRRPGASVREVVLLTDGAIEAEVGEERLATAAPALVWLGSLKPGRLRAAAGTTGFHGSVSDEMLVAAIGDQPESVNLRYLSERDFVLSLAGHDEQAQLAGRCFGAMVTELRQPRDGSSLLLSALLRIVMVTMLRLSAGGAPAAAGTGERTSLLQKFRRLVEMNFRSHWTVAQYAAALGISPDRLHAICTAGIGKSPKALISERLAQEAAVRLERSSLTIQQLGHSLGFNDPAHFTHFFRKMMGVPPNGYRRAVADAKAGVAEAPARNFADWP